MVKLIKEVQMNEETFDCDYEECYDYDIDIRSDGKANEVVCRLSSMPTELQKLIIAGYLKPDCDELRYRRM